MPEIKRVAFDFWSGRKPSIVGIYPTLPEGERLIFEFTPGQQKLKVCGGKARLGLAEQAADLLQALYNERMVLGININVSDLWVCVYGQKGGVKIFNSGLTREVLQTIHASLLPIADALNMVART